MANWASQHQTGLVANDSIIRMNIDSLIRADNDTTLPDYRTRNYYKARKPFIWISRTDIYPQLTDTLLTILEGVRQYGFAPQRFMTDRVRNDLAHLDSLQFDDKDYQLDKVLARLEYNLTKGFLRFITGERFGYMNPEYIFNRLDRDDKYPNKVVFRRVFDIPVEHPDSAFFEKAFNLTGTDETLSFVEECRPKSDLLKALTARLDSTNDKASRSRLMANMERCRWRLLDQPENHEKRVVVNIPAFRVWAFDRDTVFSMKIACGAKSTKTPLLTSKINRMEMNPLWIIPRSIIEKEVIAHVDDSAYFARNHYFIRNKQTGDTIPPQELTRSILMNPNYMIAQERGAGNSLGRIIFRFDNAFAVYLHDTNSPGVFRRDNRAVSHGCVRLERPLDMAEFLLNEKNPKTIEKIYYSTHVNLKDKERIDKSKMLSSLPLSPSVPVFITYYTLFPDENSSLQTYPDIYGYDSVISRYLTNYE